MRRKSARIAASRLNALMWRQLPHISAESKTFMHWENIMVLQRWFVPVLSLGALLVLAGCGDDKKHSKFVDACLKHPNSLALPEAKRAGICACYEANQTTVLNAITDADVKQVFDSQVEPAMAGSAVLKVANDPAKGQALDGALKAFADGAALCRKAEGL